MPRSFRNENARLRTALTAARAEVEEARRARDLLAIRADRLEQELATARANAGAGFANLGRLFTYVNAVHPELVPRFIAWAQDAETTADRDARRARAEA